MKENLTRLLEQLRQASAATRLALLSAVGLLVAVLGVSVYQAGNPHFVLLRGELDDLASARVTSALANGGIKFKVSQPPAPYFVYVDEAQEYQAWNAVALAGALEPRTYGIPSEVGGASSAFQSALDRLQSAQKRDWQEMEKQLEVLDFVARASVTTSRPEISSFRKSEPVTVSVTLTLREGAEVTKTQTDTVAKLVRHRFGVPAENVIISDQQSRTLFDGSTGDSLLGSKDIIEHKLRWERDRLEQISRNFDQIYGPDVVEVMINSEWTYDQTESVIERLDPANKVVIHETKQNSRTPQNSNSVIGGPAGITSSLSGNSDGVQPGSTQASEPAVASMDESEKTTRVGRETQHVVSRTPIIQRLTVSLLVDESLATELASLESSVKEAVGFDTSRGDSFSSLSTRFANIARDADGNLVEPEPAPPVKQPNQMLEVLLERGVEIVAALAFLFLLFKALKSSGSSPATSVRSTANKGGGPSTMITDDEIDPERLAQAQVEELLQSDPERVGEILSRWAADDRNLSKVGK